mmetsp:Transcript_6707/g.27344  ORF Transcript_6707/g.27344 Transcript_6707/m.27344 type:complete len:292 (-) Transcript_6707:1246-2121(-)
MSVVCHRATGLTARVAPRAPPRRVARPRAIVTRGAAVDGASSSQQQQPRSERHQQRHPPGLGRRAFGVGGAALVASTLLESTASVPPARAFTRPPPGYRPFNDTIDGYKLFRPEDWIEVKGSGNDVFFRNPSSVEENMFVSISSPSSTKFASPRDLGTPDEAARKILAQYLNEFMSSRLGVRRESSVVSATEREGTNIDGEPMIFYDVELRITSYAAKNQYGLTEADRPQSLEWDRVLSSTLGVANNRLYELRFQTSADEDEAEWRARYGVMKDSFKPFDVDQSNLSFPLF